MPAGGELTASLHAVVDNEDDSIHAVVTDVQMPEFNGLEILEGVRKAGRTLPFVLITAFGDEETHDEAPKLKAAVINKPFDEEDLVTLVAGLLREEAIN